MTACSSAKVENNPSPDQVKIITNTGTCVAKRKRLKCSLGTTVLINGRNSSIQEKNGILEIDTSTSSTGRINLDEDAEVTQALNLGDEPPDYSTIAHLPTPEY